MRSNTVKRALQGGGVSLGTFLLEFGTTGIARIAAAAGADYVLFDMEHTGWSMETIRTLMAASRCADTVPIVRVPATQYHFLARVLDVGAMGVMVPMVESEEQARLIVQSCKYPPAGRRGVAYSIAHDDYEPGDFAEKGQRGNDETLLIAQVETAAGVENVEAIAAVEGLDVLWVGQADLTSSLGIPGQFTHPAFLSALERVLAAAKRHGKTAGYLALTVEEGKQRLAQGFRCLAYGGDLWLYQQALAQGIAAIRAGA